MQQVTFGKTGLTVSVAGLGCGGHSRLGQSYGNTTAQSIAIIHAAMDMGVNFIDTATAYGTEPIVGEAIKGRRDEVILSTKRIIFQKGTSPVGTDLLSGEDFITGVEDNLKLLGTDCIDVLHLHGVFANQYDHCVRELVPALHKLREQGKIRFLGITERFISDTDHTMLSRALDDDFWDVVMTGFNMINPSARRTVLPKTQEKNIATLIMFAVRRALSDPTATAEIIRELAAADLIDT
ncbi:MAG: aldo/keto reductase, partial [Hyphomicrobiales bacterium]